MVQSMPNPNCAPTCEYVAIPLGSSSEAPVIRPGPNLRNSCAMVSFLGSAVSVKAATFSAWFIREPFGENRISRDTSFNPAFIERSYAEFILKADADHNRVNSGFGAPCAGKCINCTVFVAKGGIVA